MKRPQPDLGAQQLQSFIGNVGGLRKFLRLWGTTTVGGVEVLHPRQYFYPANLRGQDFKKLFKYLGAYESVTTADYKGVENAWMYLNKNNGTLPPANTKGFVADNLNKMWWDPADGDMPTGLTLTTTILIEGLIDDTVTKYDADGEQLPETVSTTSLLDPQWPEATLISAIQADYDALWSTCVITQQGVGVINKGSTTDPVINVSTPDEDDLSPNDPWLSVYSRNVLRSNGPPCTIKSVSVGIGKTESGRLYNTYVVTLEIPYHFINEGSLFVEDISNDINGSYSSKTRRKLSYSNGYYTKKAAKGMSSSDLETDPLLITRPYRLWEDEASEQNALFSSIWYKYGGKWYLRADALRKPRDFGLTYKDVNYYLWPLVDSDYKKEKVPWWKKFVAAVLFVVAVVGSFYSSGATLGWASASAALLAGGLVLTILTLVAGVTGEHGWASAFASISKEIEPLVIVATIITLTSALRGALDKATSEAANQLGKEAVDVTLGETVGYLIQTTAEGIVDNIVQGATDFFSGTVSKASLEFTTNLAKLAMTPEKNKLKDLQERNKDLKAEYEGLTQEMNQEYDALRGFAKIYARPATADWSMYAATFDQPYERGGGPLALGNIQRTTKQALRKADYDDPAFAGIIGL